MDPDLPQPSALLPQSVARMPLRGHVTLGKTNLPLREAFELSVGSVVELGKPASDPVELVVNGKVLATGQLVVVQGNYALKVLALCPK